MSVVGLEHPLSEHRRDRGELRLAGSDLLGGIGELNEEPRGDRGTQAMRDVHRADRAGQLNGQAAGRSGICGDVGPVEVEQLGPVVA